MIIFSGPVANGGPKLERKNGSRRDPCARPTDSRGLPKGS